MAERQRRDKGAARRQAIVDAAVELIAENAEPLSHRATARRAGVPDSAPSYYFESIEELTVEAFRTAIRGFIARIEALTAAVEETAMTPEEVIRAYAAGSAAETRATRLQFIAYLYATSHPALQREVESAVAAMTGAAEGVTLLLVEQNARLALEVSHRGYVLEGGTIGITGEARALLGDPRIREAYLGE